MIKDVGYALKEYIHGYWAHLNEREVQLVQVGLFSPHCRLIRRDLHGDSNDEVANA